jgi:superfamily II DNA/RNA helicase
LDKSEIFDTQTTFADLGLNESILADLDRLGFKHPTFIQSKLIPIALSGKDCLGQAKTGTGKTASFALPALQML